MSRRERFGMLVATVFVLAWMVLGWGDRAASQRASQRAQELVDSIATLDSLLEGAQTRADVALGRVEVVEAAHAQDSVQWRAERQGFAETVEHEDSVHNALGDSISAQLEGSVSVQYLRQQEAHELIVASKDAIIVSQAEEIAGLQVRVAGWMALAEERLDGWELESQAHGLTRDLAEHWEAEYRRARNPSTLRKIIVGLPWLAAGYVGAKLDGL